MSLIEISNQEELESWLKDRPREDSVLIASRCAMRVFPLLARIIAQNGVVRRRTVVLPTIRALSAAGVAVRLPTKVTMVRDAAAEAAEDAAYAAADAAARSAARAAACTSDAAACAAACAAVKYAARAAGYSASNAVIASLFKGRFAKKRSAARSINAASVARADFWKAVDFDATGLQLGFSHQKVYEDRLWHSRMPGWIRGPWLAMQDHLLTADEGWQVWINWYQDHLDGNPVVEELELARALIPSEVWTSVPAALNAKVAVLTTEHGCTLRRSEGDETASEPVNQAAGHRSLRTGRFAISAQAADLHDRVAEEIAFQKHNGLNGSTAVENIAILETLQTELADLSYAMNLIPEDPTPEETEPATDRAWNLRYKIEDYARWITRDERTRQMANGTLFGGMVSLLISLGWSPLPRMADAIALIGGDKLKANLFVLIRQMKTG